MPRTAKTSQTPASVLRALMEEYRLNPNSLSKKLKTSNTTIHLILLGKLRVSVPTAYRLSKFFGQIPAYWLELQLQTDLQNAENDMELQQAIKDITKAEKPAAADKSKKNVKLSANKAKDKPVNKTAKADKTKKPAKSALSKRSVKKA